MIQLDVAFIFTVGSMKCVQLPGYSNGIFFIRVGVLQNMQAKQLKKMQPLLAALVMQYPPIDACVLAREGYVQ